jgi:hypothetical protein
MRSLRGWTNSPPHELKKRMMKTQSFTWFVIFALVLLVAAFAFLFLVANPGERMPGPLSSEPTVPVSTSDTGSIP